MADRLNEARLFVECASLAVEGAPINPEASAICCVLDEAIDRMHDIAKAIAALPGR